MRVVYSRQGDSPNLLRGAEFVAHGLLCVSTNIYESIAHMAAQEDLAKLEERDPEFFAYLQQTDSGLLNFCLPTIDTEAEGAEEEDASAQQFEARLSSLSCSLHIWKGAFFSLFCSMFRT